jgi:hypothetical protein
MYSMAEIYNKSKIKLPVIKNVHADVNIKTAISFCSNQSTIFISHTTPMCGGSTTQCYFCL